MAEFLQQHDFINSNKMADHAFADRKKRAWEGCLGMMGIKVKVLMMFLDSIRNRKAS